MEYRINGFEQIKAFYSWVFNNAKKRVTPQHISLYLFLINQNNRNGWVEWFKCPYDLGMAGACIGNKKTYYSCLSDLKEWELIQYEKGINEFKAPLIKIEVLKYTSVDTASVPQSEPLPIPLPTSLPIPLPTHIYKLITDNLELITDNFTAVEKMIKSLAKEDNIPSWKKDFQIYLTELRKEYQNILTPEYIKERESYHPNLDIKRTIEKACLDFWSTEKGWKNKKAKKTKDIDWKGTFNNSLTEKMNQVWKPRKQETNQMQQPSSKILD